MKKTEDSSIAFYFADKIAAVFRLAPGTEFIDKLTNGFAVFGTAFAFIHPNTVIIINSIFFILLSFKSSN